MVCGKKTVPKDYLAGLVAYCNNDIELIVLEYLVTSIINSRLKWLVIKTTEQENKSSNMTLS